MRSSPVGMESSSTERMHTDFSTQKWIRRAVTGINYIYLRIHKEKMDVNENGRR